MSAIESKKRSEGRVAGAVEARSQIYIGAPTKAKLLSQLKMTNQKMVFYPNDGGSPAVAGLVDRGEYFEVQGDFVCDGDLGLSTALILKDVRVRTQSGCRIHVAGPLFQQGTITYEKLGASGPLLMNLQLVSSESISMGIGTSHCETGADEWYAINNANYPSPLDLRFGSHSGPTRTMTAGERFARKDRFVVLANKMGVRDASCRGGSEPRAVNFERLLLVAPTVQSRYTGQFTGVIVAEYANFALSKFTFKFDPVFKSVPVLPLLDGGDYLLVK